MKKAWLLLIYLMFASCSPEPVYAQTVYFSSVPNTLVNGSLTNGPLIMGDFDRIVSDGNAAYTNFLVQIAGLSGAPTPAGAVVPFNLAACPTGWIPANGTSGTPDLRGKFIRATMGTPVVGTVEADTYINHFHVVPGTFFAPPSIGTLAFPSSTSIFFTSSSGSAMTVGPPISGNVGYETRPKNVALLYCQKT